MYCLLIWIGAGVIGLCIARKMCKKIFILLFKSFGKEGSSRNSVIHAGIYYKKSSKKSIFWIVYSQKDV